LQLLDSRHPDTWEDQERCHRLGRPCAAAQGTLEGAIEKRSSGEGDLAGASTFPAPQGAVTISNYFFFEEPPM
jgi:hypothetical protein